MVDTTIDLDVNAFLIKLGSETALSKRLGNMLRTASDHSWLRPEEDYLEVELNDIRDPKVGRINANLDGSAARRARWAATSRFRVGAEISAQYPEVFQRISGLTGPLKNSDLAGSISGGVGALIGEIDAPNALEVVSVFDDLEKRGICRLDDIAGVLNSGSGQSSEQDAGSLQVSG